MTSELIIAGFHRSGTSFTAQTLHHFGLFLGDDLVGAMPSNPYGHFEDREVVRWHDAVLQENNESWQIDRQIIPVIRSERWEWMERFVSARRRDHRLWGLKDPRVCLFLGAWRHLMPDAKVLGVYRPYWSSIASLHRRHGREYSLGHPQPERHLRFFQEPDLALRMWIHHNRAILRERKKFPDSTMLVSFASVAAGFPLIERARSAWGFEFSNSRPLNLFDPSATATTNAGDTPVLDPGLRETADLLLADLDSLHSQ